jgi:hypothetical protein
MRPSPTATAAWKRQGRPQQALKHTVASTAAAPAAGSRAGGKGSA